jgi:hypothetical protein
MNKIITISNSILSVSVLFFLTASWVQTMLFAGTSKPDEYYSVFIGLLSLSVVITTVLHYLFGLEEAARNHQRSGQQYSNLMKKIERYGCSKKYLMDSLHVISRQYSNITNSSPIMNRKIWNDVSLSEYTSRIQGLEEQVQEDLFGHEYE